MNNSFRVDRVVLAFGSGGEEIEKLLLLVDYFLFSVSHRVKIHSQFASSKKP